MLDWISDLFCTQLVVCGGFFSSPAEVKSGVPQGTVLGHSDF